MRTAIMQLAFLLVCLSCVRGLPRENAVEVAAEPKECEDDEGCQEIENANCDTKNNKCQCKENYFFNGDYSECLVGVGAACEGADECGEIDGEKECSGKKCQCIDNYYGSADYAHCYKMAEYTEDKWVCVDNTNCGFIDDDSNSESGSTCNDEDKVCTCKAAEWFIQTDTDDKTKSKCAKGVGAECTKNEDCGAIEGEKECSSEDKKCQCTDEYYGSADNAHCYKMAEYIDEKFQCEDSIDCGFIVDDSNDAGKVSTCEGNVCTCKGDKWFIQVDTKDHKNSKCVEDGKACAKDDDCKGFGNAECNDDSQCQCSSSYFFNKDGTKCLAGVGADCAKDEDCGEIEGEKECSSDEKCQCKDNYYGSADSAHCYEMAEYKDDKFECDDNNNCAFIEDGSNTDDKVSTCDGDDKVCTCKADDWYIQVDAEDKQKSKCVKGAKSCEGDEDCEDLGNAECKSKKCQCKSSYFYNDDITKCLAGVGAECSNNDDCGDIDEIQCSDKKCKCKEGYYGSADYAHCYKQATYDKDNKKWTCEKDTDCGFMDDDSNSETGLSSCLDKECSCKADDWFLYINETNQANSKCTREIGAVCTKEEECNTLIEHSTCAKNTTDSEVKVCKCNEDYDVKDDNTKCQSGSATITATFSVLICAWVLTYKA